MRESPEDTRPAALAEALRYAKAGWAVVPLHSVHEKSCTCGRQRCQTPGKHPTVKGGAHAGTKDPRLIQALFSGDAPRNVGIATGDASGLFVLDVDPRHGGDAALVQLQKETGELPKSNLVSTGGGGLHYYLSTGGHRIGNSAGMLGHGLDVRGYGGYVVAPPSQHISGNCYAWLAGGPQRSDNLPCATPELLRRILASSKSGAKVAAQHRKKPFLQGGRNAALVSVAGRLVRQGAKLQKIQTFLLQENQRWCVPPLEEAEVTAIATSVMRYADKPKILGQMQHRVPEATVKAHQPWANPVNGAHLLDEIVEHFKKHLVLPLPHLQTMALWVLFSHTHAAFRTSPILAFISPDRRCGKTTALSILRRIVNKALATSNITTAAVFRAIDLWQPTLLIDEADTFLGGNEQLRGILNSGHQRDMACVIRSVGENHEPKAFSTWCAKVIAKIGPLNDTLADRAITIPMRRKAPTELCQKLTTETEACLEDVGRKAARWAHDAMEAATNNYDTIPQQLNDRAQDNWRPLLRIATIAGEHWPKIAADAALHLAALADPEDLETTATLLLNDIRDAFDLCKEDRITSQKLCGDLAAMDHRPWPEWRSNRPITPRQVAQILRPFGIRPKSLRCRDLGTPKGYQLEQFADAFARYLEDNASRASRDALAQQQAFTARGGVKEDPLQNADVAAGSQVRPYAAPAENKSRQSDAALQEQMGPPEEPIEQGDRRENVAVWRQIGLSDENTMSSVEQDGAAMSCLTVLPNESVEQRGKQDSVELSRPENSTEKNAERRFEQTGVAALLELTLSNKDTKRGVQ